VDGTACDVHSQRSRGTTDQLFGREGAAGGREDQDADDDSSHAFSFKSEGKSPTTSDRARSASSERAWMIG
jgi:hypothetical protein